MSDYQDCLFEVVTSLMDKTNIHANNFKIIKNILKNHNDELEDLKMSHEEMKKSNQKSIFVTERTRDELSALVKEYKENSSRIVSRLIAEAYLKLQNEKLKS